MKRKYHVVESRSKQANEVIRSFCAANGQILAPLVDLGVEAAGGAPAPRAPPPPT